jgi:hypothetical protein
LSTPPRESEYDLLRANRTRGVHLELGSVLDGCGQSSVTVSPGGSGSELAIESSPCLCRTL